MVCIKNKTVVIGFCWFLLSLLGQEAVAANSEAYLGEPFGVGRVTIDVLRGEPSLPLSDERFTVLEANGRALYPALKQTPVRKLVRGWLGREAPRKVTIYYLFQGVEPFELSLFGPNEQGARVKPLHDSARHRRLLLEWWEQYTKYYQGVLSSRAYPPVAENFLVASLSRRLGLPMPKPRRSLLTGDGGKEDALGDLFINEAHRLRIDRTMLAPQSAQRLQRQPLPEPIEWAEALTPVEVAEEIEVERLATHVPAECFYLRFGNFTNYLWFRDLNKKWQGDLGNMIFRRGIQRSAGQRIQQQLSLRESALAKILGPQVIADAAIIGLDPYLEQGASIGILFQAKNEFLLSADLTKQRSAALSKYEEAKEETLEIEGHSVSYISTPSGQVRSYYVKRAGFHLVTTSLTLVKRFLEAGQGDRSLASLASFRRARQEFPLERGDTMFAFISQQFWNQLSSPQVFIENERRLRASREALLLKLARYAAKNEAGKKQTIVGQSVPELIAAGMLPAHFGTRVDGSKLLELETGDVDSLRGARGYFLPIADMPIDEVTAREAAAYKKFVSKFKESGGQLPPLAAAVQRTSGKSGGHETISVDLFAAGALRKKLGKVGTWLGQPAEKRLQPVAGDLLSVEAIVDFPSPLTDSENAEQHLFGALRDYRAPLIVSQGVVKPGAGPAELVRGYLGAWPKPGLLEWFTRGEAAQGLEPQQLGGQMWQAKQEDFLLLSFKPDVIQQVLPQLALQPTESAGQVWIRLADLTGTQMAENVNALGYMRTRETSAAGSRMMNSLANQLGVPRDECRAFAERLVDGKFICPLGGKYQLFAPERGLEVWASSALPEQNRFLLTAVSADFRLPLLEWFRGLTGELRLDRQALCAHLEIKMTRAALP